MPSITSAVDVVDVPDVTISEYFGNVATQDGRLSAAHVKIHKRSAEAWQTPKFDEYVLITSGEVHLLHAGGKTVVTEGSGVFLKAGLRVRWVFPGPCSYVPICLPGFTPDNVGREEEAEGAASGEVPSTEEVAAGSTEGLSVITPVEVVQAPSLKITEYFGNVANQDPNLSACLATVSAPCAEAYQTPDFDEYVLVLEGEVHLQQEETTTVVGAGKAAFLKAGERVKWCWQGPCSYVPICMPAFTPDNCHREEEEGVAKDKAAMDRLHALHDTSKA